MSKFFVGQRVRCVKTLGGGCLGLEGVVLEVNASGRSRLGLTYDGNGLLVEHAGVGVVLGPPYCWEPITPSGAQPSEFRTLHDLLESLEGIAA